MRDSIIKKVSSGSYPAKNIPLACFIEMGSNPSEILCEKIPNRVSGRGFFGRG